MNYEAKDFLADAKTDENELSTGWPNIASQSRIVDLAIMTYGSVVIIILYD